MGNRLGIGSALLMLGETSYRMKDYDNAIKYLRESLEIAEKLKIKEIKNIYFLMSEVYSNMDNRTKAYEYLKKYSTVQDSLNKEEKARKISDLQVQFEMEKKENELKIKELELSKQKNFRNFLIIGIILIFIIAIIIYLGYLLKKKTNKLLKEKNLELERTSEIKDKYLSIVDSDLKRAADYVVSLLPPQINKGHITTQWHFIPSAKIGGDSFGYHWIDNDNFAIYLIDVSGHGVGSALHSVTILNVLKYQTLAETDFKQPEQVLSNLNKTFQMNKHNKMFFTIWYGIYNKRTHNLKYASGGHPPALLINNNNEIIHLGVKNYAIGGAKEFLYSSDSCVVAKPANIYIFSDGVYEIIKPDGTIWTLDELYEYLVNQPHKNGYELNALYKHVKEMRSNNNLEDDFSMLKVTFS